MKEERSFVYTLILGVCMLLSLLLIGKMLIGKPPEKITEDNAAPTPITREEEKMEIKIDEALLMEMVQDALPVKPEKMTLHINENNTIELTASINKENLANSGLIAANMRTVLLFLPEQCDLYGAWKVNLQNNALQMQSVKTQVAGFSITSENMKTIDDAITEKLGEKFKEMGYEFSNIEFEQGEIHLID